MKYIEELKPGNCFELDKNYFILTADYKKNGNRLCYSLQNGLSRWFDSQTIVTHEPIYTLDKDNNVVAVKPTESDNDTKAQNFS